MQNHEVSIFKSVPLLLTVLLVSVGSSSGQSTEIIKAVRSRTVDITVRDEYSQTLSSGTGFIVGTEGEIATNYHVIEGASSAIVKFYGHRGSHNVKSILHKDIENDIAVIKVHFKTTPLNFGDDNITQVGERIMAIGNPLGLTGTVSDGVVSGFRKMEDGSRRMQISAPISPGSSGGPVINKQGEVIGIATSYLPRGQNLNFAVPVTKLKRLMATRRLNIPFGAAHLPKAPKLKESTEIKVLKADWGGASLRDIHAVLHSTSS
ncbi:MAG: trypsin-like peptidase domain-containing protein, partial [Opitutales bacterium]